MNVTKIRKYIKNCLIGLGVVAACTAMIKPEAFVNGIGWVPVSTLPTDNYYVIEAQSVAKGIQILPGDRPGENFIYRCTWWVVDQEQRIMMANGHCYNQDNVELGIQGFPFEMTFPNGQKASCDEVIAYSPWEGLDYMAVRCQDPLPPALRIDMKTDVKVNDKLVHISWNCDYIEESFSGNRNCEVIPMIDFTSDCKVLQPQARGGADFMQGCDSLGGSSGSPVHLEKNGLVIGLHHSGRFFRDSQKFGDANGSVHIRKVVEDIRRKQIGIKFITNEDRDVSVQPPAVDPVAVDSKPNTEDISFLDLLSLIFQFIGSIFK